MNKWLVQIQREFWENQSWFIHAPLVLSGLMLIAGLYVVTVYEPGSDMAWDIYGHNFSNFNDVIDSGNDSGTSIDFSGDGIPVDDAGNPDEPEEFYIDFTTGELVTAEEYQALATPIPVSNRLAGSMNGIQVVFMVIIIVILLFYLLSSMHSDRKDRSILFWKSMPVSETMNVTTKYLVTLLVFPLLITVISWAVQTGYLLLSSIYIFRTDGNPWETIWSQVSFLSIWTEQLKLVLWCSAWWLPVYAWLIFSSALGRRSPFLVATMPFAVVIVLEIILFDESVVAELLLGHLETSGRQMDAMSSHIMNDGLVINSVNLFVDNTSMVIGFVIAALLFPVTVWLRNHRFEI